MNFTQKTFTKFSVHAVGIAILSVIATAFLNGCNPQAKGFVLPEGDVSAGKQAFVQLGCDQCHSIADIAWKGDEAQNVHVQLGGKVRPMKTYGELLTSVINPSHKIRKSYFEETANPDGSSVMEQVQINEVMTVEQLVDVVTFLEDQYELMMPREPYTYKGW